MDSNTARQEAVAFSIGPSLPKPGHADCAVQIFAQQPLIEIDVLSLGSEGAPPIFPPLAFIEIPLNLAVCTQSFSISPRPVNPGAALFERSQSYRVYGGQKLAVKPATGTGRSKYLRNKLGAQYFLEAPQYCGEAPIIFRKLPQYFLELPQYFLEATMIFGNVPIIFGKLPQYFLEAPQYFLELPPYSLEAAMIFGELSQYFLALPQYFGRPPLIF